jgi:sterol desaturase/sphingolipid hydroxylase (fatty acid hydroxylase superfamily)
MFYENYGIFTLLVLRNYILIDTIEYSTRNNENIDAEMRLIKPKESFSHEFDLFLLSSTFIEYITHLYIKETFYDNQTTILCQQSFFHDLQSFILISFYFEIIFDLFHYLSHLLLHKNTYLYKNIHKIHHKFKYPSSITTFYQHPVDIILSNLIPIIITMYIIPVKPTYFQYIMISTYKIFSEISGHLGKHTKSISFSQFIWLPKLLNIELKIEDHDLHHSNNNCNYGKRFSLYDKIFGTYKIKNKII